MHTSNSSLENGMGAPGVHLSSCACVMHLCTHALTMALSALQQGWPVQCLRWYDELRSRWHALAHKYAFLLPFFFAPGGARLAANLLNSCAVELFRDILKIGCKCNKMSRHAPDNHDAVSIAQKSTTKRNKQAGPQQLQGRWHNEFAIELRICRPSLKKSIEAMKCKISLKF